MGKKHKKSKSKKHKRNVARKIQENRPVPQETKQKTKRVVKVDKGKPERTEIKRPGINMTRETYIWFCISLILLAGIFFLWIGFKFSYHIEPKEIVNWDEIGPSIAIACDRPFQGINVDCYAEENGRTRLVIRIMNSEETVQEFLAAEDGIEGMEQLREEAQAYSSAINGQEGHVWIELSAGKAPVKWKIDSQMDTVENYDIATDSTVGKYKMIKSKELEGHAYRTAFRMAYDANYGSIAEIEFFLPEGHAMYSVNGICRPILPCVGKWYGEVQSDNETDNLLLQVVREYQDIDIDSQDWLKLKINDAPMYYPLLKIHASYISESWIREDDMVFELASPEPEVEYPIVQWSTYDNISPMVQLHDRKWEQRVLRNNLLGGIFVGLGINVLCILPGVIHEKKENDDNRKKNR